jgi:hypothetical protein
MTAVKGGSAAIPFSEMRPVRRSEIAVDIQQDVSGRLPDPRLMVSSINRAGRIDDEQARV